MYWGIPPEINAFRLTMMGAGPAAHTPQIAALQMASTTHIEQGVQQQVTAAATSVGFVGAGGMAMMAAAIPQAIQNHLAGAHAEAAVGTINAGVGGYCSAVAATIPHPVVVANRLREAFLESTNVLGITNLVPIAQTQAEYGQFWGQNATAMMGYLANTTALLGALSVPMTVLPDASNPAGPLAAVASALGGQGLDAGIQGVSNAVSGVTQGAGTAASMAGEVGGVAGSTAAQTASSAKAAGQPAGAPSGMPGNAASDGQADQGMQQGLSTMMSAPSQLLSSAGSPLSQAGQLPNMLGSQFGSLLNPLSSLAGGMGPGGSGPGGLGAMPPMSAASAPWSGLSGANGGFAGGGSAVTAALTKPSAGGIGGPVGLPGAWWNNVDSEAASSKTGVGLRGGPAATPGAMGTGMYPMGAAANRGRGRDEHVDLAEADHLIALPDTGFTAPVVTDDGVVYTGAQGG